MPSFTSLQFISYPTQGDLIPYIDLLIEAAGVGNRSYVRDILDNYPGLINRKNKDGRTALMYAAEKGCDLICSTLIYRHAKVDITVIDSVSGYQLTPLLLAVQNNHLSIVKMLLASTVSIHQVLSEESKTSAIHIAALSGNVLIVQELVQYDRRCIDKQDASGKTALFIATEQGHVDVVDYLVTQMADLNCAANEREKKEYNHLTPVLLARALKFKNRNNKVLNLTYQYIESVLIKHGATESIQTKNILSLLDWLLESINVRDNRDFIRQDTTAKRDMLIKIRHFLQQRMSHKALKSETVQEKLLAIIARICAISGSFYSLFKPESLSEFSNWVSWQCPNFNFDMRPYLSNEQFEREYCQVKSYIALPSLDGQEWADLVTKEFSVATVESLIRSNIFTSNTIESVRRNTPTLIDQTTGPRRLPV